MIPGEVFPASGEILLNKDRTSISLKVANTGDRPLRSAVIITSLRPTRLSTLIGRPRSAIASTFRQGLPCDLNQGNRVKFR